MDELTADETSANSCCAPEARATCCGPSAKAKCCDPSHGLGHWLAPVAQTSGVSPSATSVIFRGPQHLAPNFRVEPFLLERVSHR
jgi:hypothetical protein